MPALPGEEETDVDEAENAHEGARLRLAVARRTTARAFECLRAENKTWRRETAGGGARVAARDEPVEAVDAVVVAGQRRQPARPLVGAGAVREGWARGSGADAHLRRARRGVEVHPIPLARVGRDARTHFAGGETSRPRSGHGDGHGLAVRRAVD